MKIFFTDQHKNFDKHLAYFAAKPVMSFDKSTLPEKRSVIELDGNSGFDGSLDFFYDYQIFPTAVLTCYAQWTHEKRKMRVGDTIVQQIYLPPLEFFSNKIVVAVRVTAIIDEPLVKGFSYQTVEGHVEKGESIFTIEKNADKFIFSIRTFSTPGNLLSEVVAPFFSLPYQAWCTRQALQHVKHQVVHRSVA